MHRVSSPTENESEYCNPAGNSLKPLLVGTAGEVDTSVDNPVSQESLGNSTVLFYKCDAVRQILIGEIGEWDLLSLSEDPKSNNLVDELPDILRLLASSYYEYAETVHSATSERRHSSFIFRRPTRPGTITGRRSKENNSHSKYGLYSILS